MIQISFCNIWTIKLNVTLYVKKKDTSFKYIYIYKTARNNTIKNKDNTWASKEIFTEFNSATADKARTSVTQNSDHNISLHAENSIMIIDYFTSARNWKKSPSWIMILYWLVQSQSFEINIASKVLKKVLVEEDEGVVVDQMLFFFVFAPLGVAEEWSTWRWRWLLPFPSLCFLLSFSYFHELQLRLRSLLR